MIRLPRALKVQQHSPRDLRPEQVEQIWVLVSRSVERERGEFEARLNNCDEIHLVFERDSNELVGLLALHIIPERMGRHQVTLLHAQWAFMAPRWRGRHVFTHIGARRFLQLFLRNPLQPVWLLYSAATVSSFSMIAKLARTFWIASQPDLPSKLSELIDRGMHRVAGDAWDSVARVLRGKNKWRYREGVLVPGARPSAPLVRRYLAANPGQRDGDAVVCLVPGSLTNWATVAYRVGRRRRRAPRLRRGSSRNQPRSQGREALPATDCEGILHP